MKKFFLGLIITLILLLGGTYLFYRFYVPIMISNAIKEGKVPEYLPKAAKTAMNEVIEDIDDNMALVGNAMRKANISFDDLLAILDATKPKEIKIVLDALAAQPITSKDQAFDIVVANYHSDRVNVELFRPSFKERFRLGTIQRGVNYYKTHRDEIIVSLPTLKSTARYILIEKKEEIIRETPVSK